MTKAASNKQNESTSALWRISGMGGELAGSIVGMLFLGWLIDRWAGTSPRWTIILSVLGLVGGGYNFARQAVKLQRRMAREAAGKARVRRERGDLPAPDLFERSTPEEGDHDEFRWPDGFDDTGFGQKD